MKIASKAKTIGDKLFQLERIHGKIVTYTSWHFDFNGGLQINELKSFLQDLLKLIECMSENLDDQIIKEYRNAISQSLNVAKGVEEMRNVELHKSCCFLHGRFVKFRQKLKKIIDRGCEIHYQKVCVPLLLLELEIKEIKMNSC